MAVTSPPPTARLSMSNGTQSSRSLLYQAGTALETSSAVVSTSKRRVTGLAISAPVTLTATGAAASCSPSAVRPTPTCVSDSDTRASSVKAPTGASTVTAATLAVRDDPRGTVTAPPPSGMLTTGTGLEAVARIALCRKAAIWARVVGSSGQNPPPSPHPWVTPEAASAATSRRYHASSSISENSGLSPSGRLNALVKNTAI